MLVDVFSLTSSGEEAEKYSFFRSELTEAMHNSLIAPETSFLVLSTPRSERLLVNDFMPFGENEATPSFARKLSLVKGVFVST